MATFRAGIVRVIAVVIGLPLAYTGCAARQSAPRFVKMQTKFDYSEHEPYTHPGKNSIKGQAFLNQEGDGVVTCAGSRVMLVPETSYFREMIRHFVARSEPDPPEIAYPSLKDMFRKTQCDAQGNFSFPNIPDGAWFILTEVNARHGGMLIREVPPLSNGTTTQVLLNDKDLVGR
jgi:hypothetical protein